MADDDEMREPDASDNNEDGVTGSGDSLALAAQETPQDPTPQRQAGEPETVSAEQIHTITARLDELERLIGELKAHDAIFDEPTHEVDNDAPLSVDEAVAALFED